MTDPEAGLEAENVALCEELAALELRRDELRCERDKFLDLYEWAPDLCASLDPATATIIEYNARTANELGYDRTELIGAHILTVFHPPDHSRLIDRFADVAAGGELRDLELRCLRKDGSLFPVTLSVTIRRDENGNVISSHGVARDITAQKEIENALVLSEARLRRLTEALNVVPWQVVSNLRPDSGANLTTATDVLDVFQPEYVGPQLEQLLGYPTARWYEPGFWPAIIHPEDVPRLMGQVVARGGREGSYRDECRMIAADGREVPVLVLTTIAQVDSGLVLSGVLADLTEVKAAELTQKNLMQELDHRVKNTFATVQSVMDQTLATSDGIETFLETFHGRVAALAAVHDTMARSDWESIDLAELISSALAPFGQPPRICTEGDGIRVTLDIGRSLGMVLHELATNAAKYGSLSTPEGTVSVRWRREIRREQSTLFLDWDESGGPPVRQTTYRGYGLRLIEDLVPYELSGKASVRFVETGLRCKIEIPLTDLGKDSRSKRGDR